MTFGAIKDRIADELVRPDLSSQIALAVNDAILEAASNRFWFNEVRGLTFPLIAGQNFYGASDIGDAAYLSQIDSLWITVNGQRRNMAAANALDVEGWEQGTPMTGEPAFYTRQADGLIFYMTPNDAYTVTVDGVTRFAPLSADGDTNAYLEAGERYIRALAKASLLEDVIRDFDEADRQWMKARRERDNLLSDTASRVSTNYVRPYL